MLTYSKEQIKKIHNKEELFNFLADLSSHIDQIHPFENGNVRVIRGLIDTILMHYGFPPLIWDNPNVIDFYDREELVKALTRSLNNTIDLIESSETGTASNCAYTSTEEDKQLSTIAFQ